MFDAIIAHLDDNMNRFYSLFRLASTREKGPMSNKAWEAAKSIAAVERAQARLDQRSYNASQSAPAAKP